MIRLHLAAMEGFMQKRGFRTAPIMLPQEESCNLKKINQGFSSDLNISVPEQYLHFLRGIMFMVFQTQLLQVD